jgi:hypothetical protein
MPKGLKRILLAIVIITVVFSVSGCNKTGRLRDMYVAYNLNNYGQGVYNSGYFKSDKDILYVVAFVDTFLQGEKIKVEMKRENESRPGFTTVMDTRDGKVTYAIPLKGPFSPGKYQVTVTYDKSVISTTIDVTDQLRWPPLVEFVFNQTVLSGTPKYSIFSDKADTAFNKNIAAQQSISIEVPATSSNWYRVKWLYLSREATSQYAYGYNELKEQNVYAQNLQDGKGLLKLSQSFNSDLWPAGTYRLEIYQDIFNKPAFDIIVDLIEPGKTTKAPGAEETAAPNENTSTPVALSEAPVEPKTVMPSSGNNKPTTTAPAEPAASTKPTELNQPSTPAHEVKENKVFMTSGLGADGKNIDEISEYPYGLKTPLYAVAVTDYSAGTTLTYGLRMVNGNINLGSKAEVVQDVSIDGMHYTLTAFTLYNKETDNWPPGPYIIELYQNGKMVASSSFKIVAP